MFPRLTDVGNSLTVLMKAAAGGNKDVVKALIEAGADLNATDSNGDTALDYARKCNNDDVIALLEQAQN